MSKSMANNKNWSPTMKIKVDSASEKAIEKIKEKGGEVVLPELPKEEVVQEEVVEEKVEGK